MIVVVDYGMGNLRSVQKAFERIGRPAEVSDKPDQVAAAERLVVPGVGAFGDAMEALRKRGLVDPIRDFVATGRPLLGICLGLQILFEESEEVAEAPVEVAAMADAPLPKGLAILPGRVVRFREAVLAQGLKVPHMGWNIVRPVGRSPLFEGMERMTTCDASGQEGVYFYFAHSYYAAPAEESVVIGRTDYGAAFASAVARGHLVATQFHPEKSQAAGLAILENFVTRL